MVARAQVAAQVLDLFHLLPKQAYKFLETQPPKHPGLAVLTMELEEKLASFSAVQAPIPSPHILWSPYRTPLTHFLAGFPQESADYFLDVGRLSNPPYFGRLLDILKAPDAAPLLAAVAGKAAKLEELLRTHNPPHPMPNGPDGAPPHTQTLFPLLMYCRQRAGSILSKWHWLICHSSMQASMHTARTAPG